MIMAMMKSSNTEWLGDIPAEWDVAQIGNYYELRNEKVSDYDFEPLSVTMKGIVPQLATAVKSDDHSNRKLVKKGDFVINSRSDRRGSCGISALDGSVSLINTVMEPRGEMNPQYYNWLFHTEQFADEFYKWGHGIVDDLWTTRWQEMKKILIVAPSPDEQQAIANYLDETCSKIDEIIAEAKASIDEYKELKKSVITNITTHGLRDVSLINSGNMDIGMIPDTWSICKTLYGLAMPITDGPHVTPELLDDGIAFISAEAVSCGRGSIDFNHMRGYISEEFYNECCKKYVPQRDDIYMIKSGATTGTVSIVDTDRKFTIWSPLAVFRVNRDRLNPRYLFYFLQSKPYQQQVQLGWTFGTQQNIGMRTLEQLKICLPPLGEQAEIVEYLDNKLPQIDSLIAEKESLINDLEAYKKSLIYEVVTGKRRVV